MPKMKRWEEQDLAGEIYWACTHGDHEERLAGALEGLLKVAQYAKLEEVEYSVQHMLMELTGME